MTTALSETIRLLQLKHYSQSTQNTYLACLKKFFDYYRSKDIVTVTKRDIETYLLSLVNRGYSKNTQNQHINAIKFYYEKVLGCDRRIYYIERPIKDKRLPRVISKEEVQAIIGSIRNLKQRAMISILYSAGLRISELIYLKIEEIDSSRMVITIRGGKGNKDRQVPLSVNLLELLRKYFRVYRPKEYLFNGREGLQYSATSIRAILKGACKVCGIKYIHPHTLRHSYATHMLEAGIDLRYIQELLGHNSSKTTEIYTHISRKKFQELRSPIEDMQIY